jgi:hypothetical protein
MSHYMLGSGLRVMFRGHLTTSQICLRCIFLMAGLGQCIVHDLEEFQPLALTHTFASAAPRSSSSRHPPIIHLFHCSRAIPGLRDALGQAEAAVRCLVRLHLSFHPLCLPPPSPWVHLHLLQHLLAEQSSSWY